MYPLLLLESVYWQISQINKAGLHQYYLIVPYRVYQYTTDILEKCAILRYKCIGKCTAATEDFVPEIYRSVSQTV
jgi:hypothetical protein